MTRTFSDLIQLSIKELSQVTGTGVQLYSEDIVAKRLQSTFNMVFDELWWDHYMKWFQSTLDGVNGVLTTELTGVTRFEDVRCVFRPNSNRPLGILPRDVQPFSLQGKTPRFIEALVEDTPNKVIQFWPKNAVGTVYIHARLKPEPFIPTDNVFIDEDLLVYGAVWDYLESDGTNPGDTQRAQTKFETRLKQIRRLYDNKPIVLDPRVGDVPLDWWTRP